MTSKFEIYFCDTETGGLADDAEIIELSLYRLSDNSQRTWCIKPTRPELIQPDALRVNGHKLEDLEHKTAYGRETYQPLFKVLPDIENFFLEDGMAAEDRILVGQNVVKFDLPHLERMWASQNCQDTFPFGKRPFCQDTQQIAILIDLLEGTRSEYYNLGTLIKKYGIKNSKAHTAEADTLATKELFMAQFKYLQNLNK